jgi:hypothetical protein
MKFIKELIKLFEFDEDEDYSEVELYEIDDSEFYYLF